MWFLGYSAGAGVPNGQGAKPNGNVNPYTGATITAIKDAIAK